MNELEPEREGSKDIPKFMENKWVAIIVGILAAAVLAAPMVVGILRMLQ